MRKPAILLLFWIPFAFSQNTTGDMSSAAFNATLAMEQAQTGAASTAAAGRNEGVRILQIWVGVAAVIVSIGIGVTAVYLWILRRKCPLCTENTPKLDSCTVAVAQTADSLLTSDSLLLAGAVPRLCSGTQGRRIPVISNR